LEAQKGKNKQKTKIYCSKKFFYILEFFKFKLKFAVILNSS